MNIMLLVTPDSVLLLLACIILVQFSIAYLYGAKNSFLSNNIKIETQIKIQYFDQLCNLQPLWLYKFEPKLLRFTVTPRLIV